MIESNKTEAKTPAEAAQLEAAQVSGANAEATGTAGDELSEDDLEAVARRIGYHRGGDNKQGNK